MSADLETPAGLLLANTAQQDIAAAVALVDHMTETLGLDAAAVQAVFICASLLGTEHGVEASVVVIDRCASSDRVSPAELAEKLAAVPGSPDAAAMLRDAGVGHG